MSKPDEENIYYFTYGIDEEYPYSGGWTEIHAPNRDIACKLFRAFHPDRTDGFLNCAWIYPREEFEKTVMYATDNFGARCREVIEVIRSEAGTGDT